ncbi:MAG: hypothetical protein AB7I18_09180 [Candidatus Berkiella sp.]
MVTAAEISNRISQIRELMIQIGIPTSDFWKWATATQLQDQLKEFYKQLNDALKTTVSSNFNNAVKNSNNDQGNALLLLLQKENELKEFFENNVDWLEDMNRAFQADRLKREVPPPSSAPPPPPQPRTANTGRPLPTPGANKGRPLPQPGLPKAPSSLGAPPVPPSANPSSEAPINYEEEFNKMMHQLKQEEQTFNQSAQPQKPLVPPRRNIPVQNEVVVPPARPKEPAPQISQPVQRKTFDKHDIADMMHIDTQVNDVLGKLTDNKFNDEMIPKLNFIRSLSDALVQYVSTNSTDNLVKFLAKNQAAISGPEKSDPYIILAQAIQAFHDSLGAKVDKQGVEDVCEQIKAAAKVNPVNWQALTKRPAPLSPMASRPVASSQTSEAAPDNTAYRRIDVNALYQSLRDNHSLRSLAKKAKDLTGSKAVRAKKQERAEEIYAIQRLVDNVVNAKTAEQDLQAKQALHDHLQETKYQLKAEKIHSALYDVCDKIVRMIESDPQIDKIKRIDRDALKP